MSMTENEAINHLQLNRPFAYSELQNAVDIAIKALEEIKQYRAIGTVEGYECAIKSSIENYNLYREYKAKVQEFEAIGTIEEFKALKEKSVAKKPNQVSKAMDKDKFVGVIGRCPNCGGIVAEDNLVCEDCFQVLDWSE